MGWREITPQIVASWRSPLVIDVRSPGERAVEMIAGSVNVPLLTDEERARIGTIYKLMGDACARRQALFLIAAKIPQLVEQILALRRHGQQVVVQCWRGGLRSEAVASVLSIAGLDCFRLTGGYKAWRAMVLGELQADAYPFRAVVLDGLTGSGKTAVLQALANEGEQVLNLEGLACHRGSVFGHIGQGKQPTQKNFDELVWRQLRSFDAERPVFLEAESRKIGRLSLPDCVLKRIIAAPAILVSDSLGQRARRLLADYSCENYSAEIASIAGGAPALAAEKIAQALAILAGLRNLSHSVKAEINQLVQAQCVSEAVELLLSVYYDPLYAKAMRCRDGFVQEVSGACAREAAAAIISQSRSFASATGKL